MEAISTIYIQDTASYCLHHVVPLTTKMLIQQRDAHIQHDAHMQQCDAHMQQHDARLMSKQQGYDKGFFRFITKLCNLGESNHGNAG